MSDEADTLETPTHEARLEAVLESISDAFYALDPDWRMVVFNRAAETYFNVSRDEVLGRNLWEIFQQGVGTPYERFMRAAMQDRQASSLETPSLLNPGHIVELRILPMRGGGVAVSLTDITERRRAEDAVKAALAQKDEILESISDAFYALDQDGRVTYVNSVAESWWEVSREELIGKSLWEQFAHAVGSPTHEAHLTAARERRVVRIETLSLLRHRWVDISIFPTSSGLAVYFRDITERKETEERQRLLVNELNHRVKNTLATVQAIAAQSLRDEAVPAEVRQRFIERLMALSRANDVLVADDWRGGAVRTIAEQMASPHGGMDDGRFQMGGPEVELTPRAAVALALGLHELATNAAKYGALSSPNGRVAVDWGIDGERLRLTWRESGGPTVGEPKVAGFGSRLLNRGLASELQADVTIAFPPAGVICEISAPLAAVKARPQP
jgi:PAS domain S-box-containing protein